MRLLLASTPVAPLDGGRAGGVERTVASATAALCRRGHRVDLVAPRGSSAPAGIETLIECDGTLQPPAQRGGPDPQPLPPSSVLEAMWDEVVARHRAYGTVVNLAYDWLPFHVADFLETPVLHHLTMGAESATVAGLARRSAALVAASIGVYTRFQAVAHGIEDAAVLGIGLDVDAHPFGDGSDGTLVVAGRVAPEKGVDDAVAVAARSGRRLEVCGVVEDASVLDRALSRWPSAEVVVRGHLDAAALHQRMARAAALLMAPHWEEALGIVAAEAAACGTPVAAYARGGIPEVVLDGRTGALAVAGDVAALAEAVEAAARLDRAAVREEARARFALGAYGARWERWLERAGAAF